MANSDWDKHALGRNNLLSNGTLGALELSLLRSWSGARPPLENRYLVIISKLPKTMLDENGQRNPPVSARSIMIRLSGLRTAAAAHERAAQNNAEVQSSGEQPTRMALDFPCQLLTKLMVQKLGLETLADGVERKIPVAWQNPLTYFGDRSALCRLRTPSEMDLVLQELRKLHMFEAKHDRIFLHLVKNTDAIGDDCQRMLDDERSLATPVRASTRATVEGKKEAKKRGASIPGGSGRGGKRQKTFPQSPPSTA